MPNAYLLVLILGISLSGCAHWGAMRVDCTGPLRAINRPVPAKDVPLVVPASPNTRPAGDLKP